MMRLLTSPLFEFSVCDVKMLLPTPSSFPFSLHHAEGEEGDLRCLLIQPSHKFSVSVLSKRPL